MKAHCFTTELSVFGRKKGSRYSVYRIPRRLLLYTVTGHITKGDGASSAPLCKRYYLTGIIPPAPGQLCNISIILWSFSNCCNPTSSLLDSSQVLQQAICTIRDISWRGCLDRIRSGHWQQPSDKIAGYELLTCSWLTRLMCSIF